VSPLSERRTKEYSREDLDIVKEWEKKILKEAKRLEGMSR